MTGARSRVGDCHTREVNLVLQTPETGSVPQVESPAMSWSDVRCKAVAARRCEHSYTVLGWCPTPVLVFRRKRRRAPLNADGEGTRCVSWPLVPSGRRAGDGEPGKATAPATPAASALNRGAGAPQRLWIGQHQYMEPGSSDGAEASMLDAERLSVAASEPSGRDRQYATQG